MSGEMATPTRVLYVHPKAERAGSDVALLRLLRARDRDAVHALLTLPPHHPLEAELGAAADEVAPLRQSFPEGGVRPAAVAQALVSMVRTAHHVTALCRARDITVVHANTLLALGGILGARRAGRASIAHIREILTHRPLLFAALARLTGRLADAIICPSEASAIALPVAPGDRHKICVVPEGIPIPALNGGQRTAEDAGPARARDGDAVTVAVVGRVAPAKGQEVFVRMIPHVLARVGTIPVRFVVVGDALVPSHDAYCAGLARLAEDLGVGDALELWGERPHAARLMAAFDIVCLPSVRPESFGLTLVEAMASGVPVVASAAGGPREVVRDGETGYLVPPGDAGALAAAVARLATDPGLRRAMGAAGRRDVAARFDIRAHAAACTTLYRGLVGAGGPRAARRPSPPARRAGG
jgi:glycosyltransferase involved in cell wall biosynthesis